MDKRTVDERQQAVAGLREFQQEATALRQALGGYLRTLERVCRQVERGVPLHEVMYKIGVGDLRADLVERLTRFETARHRMRLVCFQISRSEGLSIGDIARLWGISRQLASRTLNEAGETRPAHANGQNRLGALPAPLRGLIGSRTDLRRGSRT